MSSRVCITICVLLGSTIGGYIPVMFGADIFSLPAIFGNLIGGFAGIWAGYNIYHNYLS